MSSNVPEWLVAILEAADSPRHAAEHLLFHGTIEAFDGRLVASTWEKVRWVCEDPCVAQCYCPETGGQTGWSAVPAWESERHLLPNGPINSIIFRELGGCEDALDATRDHTGRIMSWRVLPNHPTNADASAFMAALGYDVHPDRFCWVKTAKRDGRDVILPAGYKAQGRLFILEKPANLRIRDYASGRDGGLSGRQWTHTDVFHATAANSQHDGILIDDVHISKQLGHFGHQSIGLFDPALATLRYHVIDIVHFDPWDCWKRKDQSTTPEFDALWASCQQEERLAA